MAILTPKQLEASFNPVTNASQRLKTIGRTYMFDGLLNSLAFVNHIARDGRNINHYPETDNQFDQVTLTLTTHGEGGNHRKRVCSWTAVR